MTTLVKISADEFLAGPLRPEAELLHGEEVVTDPKFEHQRAAKRILVRLDSWASASPDRGEAGFGGNWRFAEDTVLKPDVWWVTEAKRVQIVGDSTNAIPDVVVEIRSPSNAHLDLGDKKRVYERAGVLEYWFVDGSADEVLVFRRSSPEAPIFDIGVTVGRTETLTTALMAEFALSVEELFPR